MTERQFWEYFLSAGLTPAGTAGLLGNLSHESGLRSNNLQNSYEKSLGVSDEEYVLYVDNGWYTNFIHDSAGFGLAQWTYWSRKKALLDYAKSRGVSIADETMQLDFLMVELTSSYRSVYDVLTTTHSVRQASDTVMTQFERPEDQSQAALDKRYHTSQGYYDRNADKTGEPPPAVFRDWSPLLTDLYDFGSRHSNPRSSLPIGFTPHHGATLGTALSMAKYHLHQTSDTDGASANIYISDNTIIGGVSERRRPWTSGGARQKGSKHDGSWNDYQRITIEVANCTAEPDWKISDASYRSLVRVCAELCAYYGWIPHFDGTEDSVITIHKQFAKTACPGPYLEPIIRSGKFERDILAEMRKPAPQTTPAQTQESLLYCVQIGAFSIRENAASVVEQVTQKLLSSGRIQSGEKGGIIVLDGDYYKVQVGAFKVEENAKRMKELMVNLGWKDAFITMRDPQAVSN